MKVADFGIAHIESSNLTQVGTVLGTPSYMSPEQIMGLPVDGRSDLFSAGVILYQFLTGERPFAGSATTTMHKVLKEDPLPPSTLNVQVPAGDGCRRAQGAGQASGRALSDGGRVRRRDLRGGVRPRRAGSAAADRDADRRRPRRNTRSLAGDRLAAISEPRRRPATATAGGGSAPPQANRRRLPIAVVDRASAVVVRSVRSRGTSRSGRRRTGGDGSAHRRRRPRSRRVRQRAAPAPRRRRHPPAATATRARCVISAVGLVDPSDPRYQSDKALLQTDLRADSKSQLVEKALGLLVDPKSLAKNYDLLKDKLLSKSGNFVTAVVTESEPQLGKDGLMSVTTQGVVNVKAVQKSLNQMSRDERIEFIRASGDPEGLGAHHRARCGPAGRAAAALAGGREHAEGAHQVVRLPHLVGRRCRGPTTGRAPTSRCRARRRSRRLSMRLRGVGPGRDQVRAHFVDGEVRRPRDRRGDLLQHDAAEGRRQLGERRRSAARRSARRSPTSSRATFSCSTST